MEREIDCKNVIIYIRKVLLKIIRRLEMFLIKEELRERGITVWYNFLKKIYKVVFYHCGYSLGFPS